MRRFLARLLIALSGFFLAAGLLASMALLETSLASAQYSQRASTFALLNAGILALAWILLRRAVAARPVLSGIIATAAVTAILVTLLSVVTIGYASSGKAKAYISAMKADLRNLVTAEEAFYKDSARYTVDLDALHFRLSPRVKDLKLTLTPDGWTASVAHEDILNRCAIFVGHTALPPATVEAEPACTVDQFDARDLIAPAELFAISAILGLAAAWVMPKASAV